MLPKLGQRTAVEKGTIWLHQKHISELFNTSVDNVALHIKRIYDEEELIETSTSEDYWAVQKEGSREVRRAIKYYNLDIIMAVGYRVNSKRTTAFR